MPSVIGDDSGSGFGVKGTSGTGEGVIGLSKSADGVQGETDSGSGVSGGPPTAAQAWLVLAIPDSCLGS